MMQRCNNGHLYNQKKHKECPYCDESLLKEGKGTNQGGGDAGKVNTLSDLGGDGAKTLAYWDNEEGVNPVVGWLVCIEGIERGKDYKIISEKNFIGRSEEMHITILGG